jgi:uncharacterized cupin superfamily protein
VSDDAVIHIDDLPWSEQTHGELIGHRRRSVSSAAGGRTLGCSMFELDPGKTAFAFHYHLGNEEAVYVLAGDGTLRLGDRRLPLRSGDYVALPAGEDHAHQITNTGAEPLRYLVLSTMNEPDVVMYPDSEKVGIFAGAAAGDPNVDDALRIFVPTAAAVDAWTGEPGTDTHPDAIERREAQERAQNVHEQIDDEIAALKRKLGLE